MHQSGSGMALLTMHLAREDGMMVVHLLYTTLYLDSGASIHILFNKELIQEMRQLETPVKISAVGQPLVLDRIGTLHNALKHLPLPDDNLHYDEEC